MIQKIIIKIQNINLIVNKNEKINFEKPSYQFCSDISKTCFSDILIHVFMTIYGQNL